jgi:LL-diaminopimelate aminotransferase
VPRTIFEIPHATEVCIEVNSFSKYAGFTGVRLGWTVVPNALKYSDGSPVRNDFNRVMTTGARQHNSIPKRHDVLLVAFNGASNIAQGGGMACLDEAGGKEIDQLIDYYLGNAQILKTALEGIGCTVSVPPAGVSD